MTHSSFPHSPWVVVTDFDGTLTMEDVGNALCQTVIPEKFEKLHKQYKSGIFSLREYQKQIWSDFPVSKVQMKQLSARMGKLRPGVVNFFKACLDNEIPVFIASCGVKTYIEAVLEAHLPRHLHKVIAGIESHKAEFSGNRIEDFQFRDPESKVGPKIPFNKGLFCDEIRVKFTDPKLGPTQLVGLGNGTSDREFLGKVDKLFATEALAEFCRKQHHPFLGFDDFFDVLKHSPFRSA